MSALRRAQDAPKDQTHRKICNAKKFPERCAETDETVDVVKEYQQREAAQELKATLGNKRYRRMKKNQSVKRKESKERKENRKIETRRHRNENQQQQPERFAATRAETEEWLVQKHCANYDEAMREIKHRHREEECNIRNESLKMTEDGTRPFRLGDLPPEIIDVVYQYALLKRPGQKPNLLKAVRINSRLYTAALKVFYRINNFSFCVLETSNLDTMKTGTLEMMRKLTLEIPSNVLPSTRFATRILAAKNVRHLTLRAMTALGLSVIIDRYIAEFKTLKTLTVYCKTRHQPDKLYLSARLSTIEPIQRFKQCFEKELNYMLGEVGRKYEHGAWIWKASGKNFRMTKRNRHVKFS